VLSLGYPLELAEARAEQRRAVIAGERERIAADPGTGSALRQPPVLDRPTPI